MLVHYSVQQMYSPSVSRLNSPETTPKSKVPRVPTPLALPRQKWTIHKARKIDDHTLGRETTTIPPPISLDLAFFPLYKEGERKKRSLYKRHLIVKPLPRVSPFKRVRLVSFDSWYLPLCFHFSTCFFVQEYSNLFIKKNLQLPSTKPHLCPFRLELILCPHPPSQPCRTSSLGM